MYAHYLNKTWSIQEMEWTDKQTANNVSFFSNQITFIVTSSQHMCLDEWNSWERAPDSAETINI